VHDQVEKYKDYIFSLESTEEKIEEVSGTLNGARNGKGTQVVIPNDFRPSKKFERICTRNGFYLAVSHRDVLLDYIEKYDNRPYMNQEINAELSNEGKPFEGAISEIMQLENHDFVFGCLNLMKSNNLMTSENLNLLADKDKCASLFKHNNFNGILFKLDTSKSEDEQKKSADGRSRYYSDNFDIEGSPFAVSSQWRPVTANDNSRKPFTDWLIEQLKNIKRPTKITYLTNCQSEFPLNRIVFGAPGTGKSYTLNNDKDDLLTEGGNFERVTFHPDYSYANFVGTYKPVPGNDKDGNETITYEYVPGPFMRILVKALKSAMSEDVKPFLLLVEEINRANVAAVFGDVFQLLDRDDDGVSEYPIATSNDMRKFLAKELNVDEEQVAEIKLPNNMFIWATMNSADQGVFPMDTAFKRRWSFEYIGIDAEEKDMPKSVKIYLPVDDKPTYYVEWNVLRKAINSYLTINNVNEDKLMGPFFVSNAVMSSNSKDTIVNAIKNKVIMYLFEDAAKRCRGVFGGCSAEERKRYSEICRKFDEDGIAVFAQEIIDKVKKNEITADLEGE
ncbi:MAG: AAA family ATPase, partial [Odoribacter sp.]|nr:AAA family ATPase [Odoribacter sp.]